MQLNTLRHVTNILHKWTPLYVIVACTVLLQGSAAGQVIQTERPSATSMDASALQLGTQQSSHQRKCCNKAHVLIGGAVGASLGALLAWRTCDAGTCASQYVTYMAIGGGVGAGVGALISPSEGFHLHGLGDAVVSPTVNRSLAGAVVRIRM